MSDKTKGKSKGFFGALFKKSPPRQSDFGLVIKIIDAYTAIDEIEKADKMEEKLYQRKQRKQKGELTILDKVQIFWENF